MKHDPVKLMLLDIDGTLIDSNDAHARSWCEAFSRHGITVPYEKVRPLIGKGSDKLLFELLGLEEGSPRFEAMTDERAAVFRRDHLPGLRPMPGARRLLERIRAEGIRLEIATSASGDEVGALLEKAQVADLVKPPASDADEGRSKPDPDIVAAALGRAGFDASAAMMLGDTPYDIQAAAAAGVETIALRCGGWWDDAAFAGAAEIHDDPAALLAAWPPPSIDARRKAGGAPGR